MDNLEELKKLFKDFGFDVQITSDDNTIQIQAEYNSVKNKIKDFKKSLELLDDCLFLDATEDLESTYQVDLKEFDDLLNKKELNEEETDKVLSLINFTKNIIKKHITDKIEDLTYLKDQF